MTDNEPRDYVSPTGRPITGTLEALKGSAHITGIRPDGTPDYEGYTEVFWDEQVTLDREGEILFVDDRGDTWIFSELSLASELETAE